MHRLLVRDRSPSIADVAGPAMAVGLSLALGAVVAFFDLGGKLQGPVAEGEVMLLVSGVTLLLVAQRGRGLGGIAGTGPGVQLAGLALSAGFLLGLLAGHERLVGQDGAIAVLFGLAVVTFLLAAILASVALGGRGTSVVVETRGDFLRHPLILVVTGTLFAIAFLNLATGAAPLLASNIDSARFDAGGNPALSKIWALGVWVIGGIEWLVVVASIRALVARKFDRWTVTVFVAGLGVLILMAGRSFLVIVGLSLVVAVASLRRLPLSRLVVASVIGLVLLGLAGKFRLDHSDPTGAQRQYLKADGRYSVFGLISQSASIGPAVLATVLTDVPQVVPFQHGRFALRDLKAAIPLHPFGLPDRGDIWVTSQVRGRNSALVGGSPPTLVGGFYIDFGVPGVIIGSALLGVLLALVFGWARRARTAGALALYSYLTAYVALSVYSYVSIKPAVVAAVVLSLALHFVEKRLTRSRDAAA